VEASPAELKKVAGARRQLQQVVLFCIFMVVVVVLSAFFDGWLLPLEGKEAVNAPSFESFLRYGTIPIIAAIIGYGTNVIALWMMFYPLEFFGYFPNAKIGCGLDLPLFGWQGVIPMKAREMAEISVEMMTEKLIKVDEVFARLSPARISVEVSDILPGIVSEVVHEAGQKHCPKLWEYLPLSVRAQIEEKVVEGAGPMMSAFVRDLQKNITEVFDLKHCVVERMVGDKALLNEMFLTCGTKEFEFIRISGFYLGFLFGILQMIAWMFFKQWWTLPACGVFVGYGTNVVALKVIFIPVNPVRLCCFRVQGLFLTRQHEVSAVYAKMVASRIIPASVLMDSLLTGPRSEKAYALVDKHIAKSMEDQGCYYKPIFLLSAGAETWADFRKGICEEFRAHLPTLLGRITNYAQERMDLETTIRTRMQGLCARDFERLLHAVFEQDEIKLILVGAILGFIVGLVQALVQTPEQLGLPPLR